MKRFSPPSDLSPYEAFIFDCDGTLVDSMPAHYIAWQVGLRAAGARFEFTWDEFLSRAGMSLLRTAEELEVKFGCHLDYEVLAHEKERKYQELVETIEPIDEVVRFAQSLLGRFPLAVATGSRRSDVEGVLARLDLLRMFPVLLTPADVARGKPDPDLFLSAAENMGVLPERCLVIEDGESGFEAARRAHMDFVVVLPTTSP